MPRETPNETMENVLYRSMSLYARCTLHTAHATDYKLLADWRKLVVVTDTHGAAGIKNVRLFRRLWLTVRLFGSSNADRRLTDEKESQATG